MTTRAWKTPRGPAPALDFERLAAMVENCAFHKWLGVNSPLTKSSSADSVLSSRHGGNQRWRWGDQRLFRMI